jgi:hypothetical protein
MQGQWGRGIEQLLLLLLRQSCHSGISRDTHICLIFNYHHHVTPIMAITVAESTRHANREVWNAMAGQIPIDRFVWLDETTINPSNQTIPHTGKYSVLPALTSEGVIGVEIIKGYIKKKHFLKFVQQLVSFFVFIFVFA